MARKAKVENVTSTLGVGLGIAGGLAQTGNPYAVAAAGVVALGTALYAGIDALTDFSGSAKKAGDPKGRGKYEAARCVGEPCARHDPCRM